MLKNKEEEKTIEVTHYIRVIHSKVKDKNIGKNHANPR